jgi:large subunit ribosomal protein L17
MMAHGRTDDGVPAKRLQMEDTDDDRPGFRPRGNCGFRYNARPGGYVRILKCGFRPGDNAPMAYVELVGRPAGLTAVDESAED